MKELVEKVAALYADFSKDANAQLENGNKAAGTRARKASLEIEKAMKEFDYAKSGYELDTAPGRVFYFYHDCKRFWKYVRPVKKSK